MALTTASAWLKRVAKILTQRNVKSAGVPSGKWTPKLILSERGDAPSEYVEYLEEEYELFGPEGE